MCTDCSGFRRKRVVSSDIVTVTITKRAGTADRPTQLHNERTILSKPQRCGRSQSKGEIMLEQIENTNFEEDADQSCSLASTFMDIANQCHQTTLNRKSAVPENAKQQPVRPAANFSHNADSKQMKLCESSSRTKHFRERKQGGNVYLVSKAKGETSKHIMSAKELASKYITPNMDTPLSKVSGMPKRILDVLEQAGLHDVGDLCMVRKNGLTRYHVLNDADLSVLCHVMEAVNIYL